MKKTKIIILSLLSVILILLPIISISLFALLSPAQYDNSFVGALDDKVERLKNTDGNRIIVVGGSSVAFGLDSALLEEYTGMPVVNFGLYAALGTKLMLDLSRPEIREGDVIVLAPELDPETLSLFFSAENTLMAADGSPELLGSLPAGDLFKLFGNMWGFAKDKLGYMRHPETKPSPEGVYSSSSFNEYGDIEYPRPENIMHGYADTENSVKLDPACYGDAFFEFADYLNRYIRYAERRGASVYFSFCPINEMGVAAGADTDALVGLLKDNIDCEFISEIDNYILEAGYFYDTNFHLNDTGVTVRTMRLARDIKLAHTIPEGVVPREEPEAPALPGADNAYLGTDENAKYFTYEKDEWGALVIVGLTEEGRSQTTLTVPLGADGIKVRSIAAGAFSGSALEVLIIPADANIERLENGMARGAENLRRLDILIPVRENITPPAKGSFGNERADFRIHTPVGSDYRGGYSWDRHSDIIIEDLQ